MATKLFLAISDWADSKPGLFEAGSPAAVIELAHRASGVDCSAAEFGQQLAFGGIKPIQRGNLTVGVKYHLSFPGHAVTRAPA